MNAPGAGEITVGGGGLTGLGLPASFLRARRGARARSGCNPIFISASPLYFDAPGRRPQGSFLTIAANSSLVNARSVVVLTFPSELMAREKAVAASSLGNSPMAT